MKRKLLLSLSFLMITAFTVVNAQNGKIEIVSIQSPIAVGASGTIVLKYTSDVPCKLNTQFRETNANELGPNWGPWHGQQFLEGLAVATDETVTFSYTIPEAELTSAALATSKPGVQYTFFFQLNPTEGGAGYAGNSGAEANLVTINAASAEVVTNSVMITSVAASTAAGAELPVDFDYTLVNEGKVKIEVRKFNGEVYVGGNSVVEDYIDPADATTIEAVVASKMLMIPSDTALSSALTGDENYKVVVTIYTSTWEWISEKHSDLTITAAALGVRNNVKKNFAFYPNPANNVLMISSNGLAAKSIKIVDMTGKTVKAINNAENIKSIDVSALSRGVYMINTNNNETYKFVKN